jgi:hypothetical protein
MRGGNRWRKLLAQSVLAAALIGSGGCLGFLHPVTSPAPTLCRAVSPDQRDHLHIFVINGLDPLDVSNLSGMCDHLRQLGYRNTHMDQMYQTPWVAEDIEEIHRADPSARFALIGFSLGSNLVQSVAHSVKEAGVTIDLMVYLSSNTVLPFSPERGDNVIRAVNITTGSGDASDTVPAGVANVNLPDVWHFGSPSHPQTLQRLALELARVANQPAPRASQP